MLANLVVFGQSADPARLRAVLDTVTDAVPLPDDRAPPQRRCRAGRVAAEVSALCHLPAPGLPQVCSERIVLRAGPQAGDLLPGAIRPLLEADLPFVLWWTDDPRSDEALFRDLGDECSRLILDLPDPGADPAAIRLGLDLTVSRYSRDTAWFGLTRWRELIAQFFDPPGHQEALASIDSVTIEAEAPGDRARPAARPAWPSGSPPGSPASSSGGPRAGPSGRRGSSAPRSRTDRPGRRHDRDRGRPRARRCPDPRHHPDHPRRRRGERRRFDLQAPAGLDRARPRSASRSTPPATARFPATVLAPEIDPARRVAAALESSRNDPPFQNALPHLLWLLEG